MKIRETIRNTIKFVNNDELSVRHMKILVAITLGFVAGLGILSYLVVFVFGGY